MFINSIKVVDYLYFETVEISLTIVEIGEMG